MLKHVLREKNNTIYRHTHCQAVECTHGCKACQRINSIYSERLRLENALKMVTDGRRRALWTSSSFCSLMTVYIYRNIIISVSEWYKNWKVALAEHISWIVVPIDAFLTWYVKWSTLHRCQSFRCHKGFFTFTEVKIQRISLSGTNPQKALRKMSETTFFLGDCILNGTFLTAHAFYGHC